MTDNARIRTLADGITGEMIAEQTHLFYDPATGGGSVSFQARESLFVDGQFQPLTGDYNILQANLADVATRQFVADGVTDPVTGADLSGVTPTGMAVWFKAVFDTLYNERAAAQAPAA